MLNRLRRFFGKDPKPFREGLFQTKDGKHKIWFAQYGNPSGQPVLFFHGGPGGGIHPAYFRNISLNDNIIAFEQRGCGRSRPAGGINNNTTQLLVQDAADLLDELKVTRKVISYGGSWGSTLALLFAEKYPARVKKIVAFMVFLARKEDYLKNMDAVASICYPEFYEETMHCIGKETKDQYYYKLIQSKSKKNQRLAVRRSSGYEEILGQLNPSYEKLDYISEKDIQACRIYLHYMANHCFLADNQILKNIGKVRHIPMLIVHNRLDMVCAYNGAYALHKALPKSKLVTVPSLGHWSDLLWKTLKKEVKDFLE